MGLRVLPPPGDLATACDELAAGRTVVLGCETTGYPGVVCAAAAAIEPAHVSFMAREACGLIALALPPARCAELELPPIRRGADAPERLVYTVSIEARRGVSTGISASDRARTMRVAADPACRAADLVRPGHVFPIQAQDGGVLRHAGHVEASLELMRLAGLPAAAAVCAILDDAGDVAGADAVRAFCARHELPLVRTADLVRARLQATAALERVMDTAVATAHGELRALGYADVLDGRQHVALVKGDVTGRERVAVQLAARRAVAELCGPVRSDAGARLHAALHALEPLEAGVVVCVGEPAAPLVESGGAAQAPDDDAVVRRILADLGVASERPEGA